MAANYVDLSSGLARDWIPVTPNNSTDNMGISAQNQVIGFYVTVGGAVVFTVDGTDRTVTFPSNFYVTCSAALRYHCAATSSSCATPSPR